MILRYYGIEYIIGISWVGCTPVEVRFLLDLYNLHILKTLNF
jgi:hypothetical protein